MSSYNDYKLEELKSISKKLDKLIEIQERPMREAEAMANAMAMQAKARYISDLIDPKHYYKPNDPNSL
jgi:hypothetical protein